ncbi:hypothetical protein ACFQHO_28780 [Actinomadura yumaensis]|uniref:hypothetical protein n=1 Tax=Actinomadura yumaensis TaxID=111807 RepID=UPI00361CE906
MTNAPQVGGHTENEIASQPGVWRRAAGSAADLAPALPRAGERVAVVGCGTSWFVAQSYAALREGAGQGRPTRSPPRSSRTAGRTTGCSR